MEEDRFHILDAIPHLIWEARPEGDWVFCNRRMLAYLDSPLDSLTGRKWLDAVHPEDRARVARSWNRSLQAGTEYLDEFRLKTGKNASFNWVLVRAVPHRNPAGEILYWCGTCTDIDQRKQIEQSLRKSEDRFRTVLEKIPGSVFVHDLNGRFFLVNEAAVTATGYSEAELLTLSVDDIDPGSISYENRDLIWRSLKPGESFSLETNHLRKDGAAYPVEVHVNAFDLEGRPVILAIAFDISARRQAAEKLRQSEYFYRQTLESIPGMVFTTRPDGHCDYESRQWETYTGTPLKEHLGYGWKKFLHPDDRPRASRAWQTALEKKSAYDLEYRLRGHDGTYEWFRVVAQPILDPKGEIARWLGVSINIEARKRSERALKESREQFRAIFEQAAVGIARLDLNTRFEEVNAAETEILGYSEEEAGRLSSLALTHPDDQLAYKKKLDQLLAGDLKNFTLEKRTLRKDGRYTWVRLTVSLVHDEAGRPQSFISVIQDIDAQKKAYDELSLNREMLQGIFDNIPVMLVIWEPRLERFTLNRHAEDVLGWTTADVNAGDFMQLVYPDADYRARVVEYMQALAIGWKEWHLTAKDGRNVPSDWANIRLSDDTMIGIGVDLRPRKRAEAALRKSEEQFRAMFEVASVGIVQVDPADGRFINCNETYCRITGYSLEELAGRAFPQLTHPEDRPRDLELFRAAAAGRTSNYMNEKRYLRKDGSVIWVRLNAAFIRDAEGRALRTVAVCEDITLRKQTERALRESEEKLRLALEAAQLGTWEYNPQTGEAFWDERSWAIYGMAPAPSISQPKFLSRVHPEDRGRIEKGIAVALTKGRFEAQYRIVMEDRTIRWISVAGNTYFGSNDSLPLRVIGTHMDITELKQVEQFLQKLNESLERQVAERTELAEARSRLLQALAVELIEAEERERRRIADLLHEDLQQLLASAKFVLESIGASIPQRSELADVERTLSECIAKSRTLTHDLSPGVLYHSDLPAGIAWLCQKMHDQFGLHVETEIALERDVENTPLKVFLFRSAKELLFNIAKHAGVDTAHLALSGADNLVTLAVRDEGAGFDPSILEKFTRRGGLGLLSLRERASYMGGGLTIQSVPGQGSRISLTVPLHISGTAERITPAAQVEEKARLRMMAETISEVSSIRVLFADDHKVMRQGLIRLISGKPDIVVAGEAGNGREALNLARQLVPDVIVMDVSMPEMDGIEATRRIKAELPRTRVIGLSMHEDAHIAQAMREAGAESLVSKTASPADLLRAIYGTR